MPRPLLRYLALAAVLATVLICRRPDALRDPQFWAEDGPIFFQQNWDYGFWHSLPHFYRHFPYLLQRILAQLSLAFGVKSTPLLYSVWSIIIGALAGATFSLPQFRHIVRNDWMRAAFCLQIVLLPDLRDAIVAVLTNVHWLLGIWMFLISLMPLPKPSWGRGLLLAAYVVCVFSTPLGLLQIPLWGLRLLRGGLRRDRAESAASLAVLVSYAVLLALAQGAGAEREYPFNIHAFLLLSIVRVINVAMFGIFKTEAIYKVHQINLLFLFAASLVLLLVGFVRLTHGHYKQYLPLIGVCLYGIVGSVFITMIGRSEWNKEAFSTVMFNESGRYFVLGTSLVYLTFWIAIDRIPLRRVKAASGSLFLLWVVFITHKTLMLETLSNLHWPEYAALLSTDGPAGGQPLEIPVNPAGCANWDIITHAALTFDEDDNGLIEHSGAALVSLPVQPAGLSQTFFCSKPNLCLVDVFIKGGGRAGTPPLTFRLQDAATGQVVSQQIVQPQDIQSNLFHTFYFTKALGSAGHMYRLSLSQPGRAGGDAISVAYCAKPLVPIGRASLGGKPLAGDIAYRYGCTE